MLYGMSRLFYKKIGLRRKRAQAEFDSTKPYQASLSLP